MKHSRRYRKIKEQIPSGKIYSISEGIKFLQDHHEEKSKNIEVSFSLNWTKQKNKNISKSKIIFPNPLPLKEKIAVVKDDLPAEMTNELTKIKEVELLSVEEA